MARLKCKCGNSLSNSTDYETDVYYIFSKKEILEAIQENPQLLYWDFYTDREAECDYWFCPRCKRMMECSLKKGVVLRIYKPIRIKENDLNLETVSWAEFYSYSDNELLVLTDKNYEQGYKMSSMKNILASIFIAFRLTKQEYLLSNQILRSWRLSMVKRNGPR